MEESPMAEPAMKNVDTPEMITRREAILRVTVMLGGATLVGGTALLTGCREENTDVPFTAEEIAFLDEVAETILPQTSTPGAKAAKTGAFMALIVTDSYNKGDRKTFRQGMRKLDKATRKAHDVPFMEATTQQRLSVLEVLDREQKIQGDALRETHRKRAEAFLTEDAAPGADVTRAPAVATTDPPAHYFRMMKELALLGYFTSEIGCTQAQRYVETPGRFDPCVPYTPGDKAWAPHA
jgi:hypothetical protein